METTNYCVCCNKPTLLKGFCASCRRKIPSGFNVTGNVPTQERYRILLEEIERNERAKAMFQKTISLGVLQLDTCNNMFHIDNAYYKVSDVTEFSFYSGEPRYQHGLFGVYQVYSDIYFAYRIKGRARCVRRLKTAQLHIEQTDSSLWVDPPIEMLNIKANFIQMIEDEQNKKAKDSTISAIDEGSSYRMKLKKPEKHKRL